MLAATHLDATFAALADPTRRAILARLARGDVGVMELAAPFAMSQPAISKHLKVLERAGLVTRGRDAQRRPVHLEAAPLRLVADWLEEYRRFWEESYERLDELLGELKAMTPEPAAKTEPPVLESRPITRAAKVRGSKTTKEKPDGSQARDRRPRR